MTDDYRLIRTNVLPDLAEVRFYEETIDHIREEHGEFPVDLPSITGAIEGAITNPTHVESSYRADSVVFVDADSTNASGDPLRVPVKRIEGTSGLLKTAFFGPSPTGSEILYKRSEGNE